MSFLESLRMKNVFGNGTDQQPLGMIDLNSGNRNMQQLINQFIAPVKREKELDRQHQLKMQRNAQEPARRAGMQKIAADIIEKKKPMDVVYKPPVSELQSPRLDLDRQKLALQRETALAKQGDADADRQVRQQRANVYEFKAKNPNMKFDFSGPTVLVSNPMTGEVTNTGMSTGSLSDQDKLELQQSNAIARIQETGKESRETERLRQTGQAAGDERKAYELVTIEDPKNPGKFITVSVNKIKPTNTNPVTLGGDPVGPATRMGTGLGNNKDETPTQTKVRQYLAAREFAQRNPDLAKFIKFGKSNEFRIVKPSDGGMFSSAGPSAADHARINQAIFGGEIPMEQPTRTGAPDPTKTTNPSPGSTITPPTTGGMPTAPPPGAKPGGRWKKTLKHGWIYVEQ